MRTQSLAMCLAVFLAATLAGCATRTTGQATLPAVEVSAAANMAARLDPIVEAPGATVGIRVIELPTRRQLYAHLPDRPMMPASNMKLVTTATALDLFGPDRQFPTRLAIVGDDLYLIGGGDPALGDPVIAGWSKLKPLDHFEPLAKALQDRHITAIKGNLYYDDRALDSQWVLPSWHERLRDYWYAAPSGGLNFNDNCIDVTVWPTAAGQPVRYEVFPPTASIHIVNRCVTGSRGEPRIAPGDEDNQYIISGICSKKTSLPSKAVGNPGAFTADAFRQYLASKGITVAGQVLRSPTRFNHPADVIATAQTAPMSAIVKRINKPSQNFLAEVLAKQSGEQYRADHPDFTGTSWQAGEAAAKAFLTRSGIDADALRAADGSGLSRDDRVTARMLTDLLAEMANHPQGAILRDSLPIAGIDGTLKNRLAQVKGRVHAKTGSIHAVRALSGYATTTDGRTLVFSILCNDIQGDESIGGVERIDNIVRAMLK